MEGAEPSEEGEAGVGMIAAGEGRTPTPMLSPAVVEEQRLLPEPPTSPPTGLIPLPSMEVDFPESETTLPMPPAQLEPMALWNEIAQLHVKLGKFGHGYAQGHRVLQGWQGKLNGMGNMVLDLHAKTSELVNRFLAIESQDPVSHIGDLPREFAGIQTHLSGCAEALRNLGGEIKRLQAWQAEMANLPTQVGQAQRDVRTTWEEVG